MRAVQCLKFGPPEDLSVNQTKVPGFGNNDILVDVKAAGVNFPDTLIIQGKYQFQPEFPFSPGGEIAGVVREVGDNVKDFNPGDRVFAGIGWGGFAEAAVANPNNTFQLPESIDFETGAIIAEAYGTSYHALVDRASIKEGETLVVLGASGGVGIAAIQIGKALGAKVIAAASTDEKLVFCKRYGADEILNYEHANLKEAIRDLTGGRGADIIYDPVGHPFTEPALRSIAWNGRYLIVGFAAGDIPSIRMNLPLLKGCSIVGVFWGGFFRQEPARNRENFNRLMELIGRGEIIPPRPEVMELDAAGLALRKIMNREVMGKIVLKV